VNTEIGILDILFFFTALLLLLFSVFLLTLKKGKRLSNFILAVFLLSKAFSIINYLIMHFQIRNPHICFILLPFIFLYGPSLYFYVRSLAYRDFSFKRRHAVHLIPFLLVSIYFIVIYHSQSTAIKIRILTGLLDGLPIQAIFMIGLYHIIIFCYLIASFFILFNYRNKLKGIFSSMEKINLTWLKYVLFGFSFIWIIDFTSFLLDRLSVPTYALSASALVLIFVFANIIVYFGLKQPEIFNGIEEKPKYIHSRLTESDKEQYLKRLRSYMLKEKPYLDPALTINELSRKVSISSRDLSQLINESIGVKFYDFVNSYRVEEAMQCLKDSSNRDKSILHVLFDAGFNTKSVFNRVFKKHTGMTPSDFKKANQI
jgi:AraC-like DNA-binding protein